MADSRDIVVSVNVIREPRGTVVQTQLIRNEPPYVKAGIVTSIVGKDGSLIYTGSGVPLNTLGVYTDLYIDNIAPNNYYQKDATNVWVLKGSLKGIDGTNGKGIVSFEIFDVQEKTKIYRLLYTDDTYVDISIIDGNDGVDGLTPYIGINGNWWIGDVDQNIKAEGVDGVSPTIGMNGNWYIGTTDTGVKAAGTDGTNGLDGVGITGIEKTGTVLNVDEYTITFSDASTFLFYVTNGIDGNDGLDGTDGRGIVSIIKTSTVGLVDTYTITYTDLTTSTFDVTNGDSGTGKVNVDQSTPQTIIGRQIQQDGLQLGLTPTVGTHETGKMFWDANWKTPACELEDSVTVQLGQETMVYVYNGTGSTLTQGDVVYSATTFNGVPSVALAKGDTDTTSQVLGIITSTTILTGFYGYATIRGHVNNLDTSLFSVNDNLYLSAEVAGKLTNVKPNTGDYDTRVGRVMIQDATTGRVYVNIIREYKVGGVSAGNGVEMFLDDTTITPSGVLSTYPIKTLSKTPITSAEDVDSIVMNNNSVMYGIYLNTAPIGKTTIQGGIWTFDIWAGVSSATNVTSLNQTVARIRAEAGTIATTNLTTTSKTVTASTGTPFATTKIDVGGTLLTDSFLRTPSGLYRILTRVSDTVITIQVPSTYVNETTVAYSVLKTLFSVNTGEINNTTSSPVFAGLQLYQVTIVQPTFTVETTDTLATAMIGTSTGSRTVYFSHNGTNRYTHFNTPLLTSHNDLAGLNDGDYIHLTATKNAAIDTHLGDATKHIDTTTAEFSGAIDETNDKFTLWDNSLLKWIRFSFTNLKSYLKTYFDGIYEPKKGTDDNYVTDAQLIVIGNTSGTNTGDNATNSQYSGLAASKQDTLVSATNIKTINGDSILGAGNLVVTGAGEVNTASNLGTGEGVYSTKVGVDLRFKSLKAGSNVTLSSDANEITINASGGGGGTSLWTAIVGTRASNTSFTVGSDISLFATKGLIVKWTENTGANLRCAMVTSSSYSSPNTTVNIVGDTMASIDANSLKYTFLPVQKYEWRIAGTIGATGTNVAQIHYVRETMRVIGAEISTDVAGTTNSTTVKIITSNGTTTLVSPSLATTVANNTTTTAPATSGLTLAIGEKITENITAIQATPCVSLFTDLLIFPVRFLNLT